MASCFKAALGLNAPKPNVRRLSMTSVASQAIGSSLANGAVALDSVKRIPESTWRAEAENHQNRIHELLRPGLTHTTDPLNSGTQRRTLWSRQNQRELSCAQRQRPVVWTGLDPRHPVYNFLIEYYGLKGVKGVKRLARWSPPLDGRHGVLLEGATADDLANAMLHLRGAVLHDEGIVYNPSTFFRTSKQAVSSNSSSPSDLSDSPDETHSSLVRAATPYLWYRSVLQQTLTAEPVLHCHGLHEWAMQYHPDPTAPPPASAKYQAHLELRVPRNIVNAVVERRGVHCTHVDALRYFSPAAAPLNHHGAVLHRLDQLRLEQPACVHAHMDLLKLAIKLQPFCDATLLQRVLHVALQARSLDVAASPYDATKYGVGIVPIETEEGRLDYRTRQAELMHQTEPVRQELLTAYNDFLSAAFAPDILHQANAAPSRERFARAEPGGLPWRRNLLEESQA
jgi:hypothetical protein